jgi:ribosome-binding factor A
MKQRNRRSMRVAEEIRQVLSGIVQRDLADPAISLISITEVDVAPDLSVAKVYVSSLATDEQERERSLQALKRSQGRIRHLLASRTKLRHTPELRFALDETAQYADNIGRLLRDVLPGQPEEGHADDASSESREENDEND